MQKCSTDDTLWKVVGAGTTDSAGNLSRSRFPFGVFVEAQALVSLTPNSPASTEVTESETATKRSPTILFIYCSKILNGAQTETEEDCDCSGTKLLHVRSRPAT
jgi:hypothetical protein